MQVKANVTEDKSTPARLYRLIALTALAAIMLALVRPALFVWNLHVYGQKSHHIRALIMSLRDQRPSDIPDHAWEEGINWTVTAHCNVCFSPDHASFENMCIYGQQLEEKLQGKIDASTLEWVWDRLAETGPQGKRYTDQFRGQFKESLGLVPSSPVSR